MVEKGESRSLEYTPTWIVAVICSIMVVISLLAKRGLHYLGKCLKRGNKDALYNAFQILQEEFMLLGFLSLLLTVSQNTISKICIPTYLANYMLPCKREETSASATEHLVFNIGRRLLSEDVGAQHCASKGKVPLVSLEGLHQLHIFIFVLAVIHVIFCATTMVLGVTRISEWKRWEDSIIKNTFGRSVRQNHFLFFTQRTLGHYKKKPVLRWIVSFFKQFFGSVTKAEYISLRSGFIKEHCPAYTQFNFYDYILRTLAHDFKRIVSIRWYLWLFVLVFLLLNINGWYTYFWLSFLPLILLLLVGAHLENIITCLESEGLTPTDDYFWCKKPKIISYLIHFILFQNSFEIGFFFWVWTTYGFDSCIMEKLGYIITKLVVGAIVQVLCSYITLPLYAIVTQMGSDLKPSILKTFTLDLINDWTREAGRPDSKAGESSGSKRLQIQPQDSDEIITLEQGTTSVLELTSPIPIPGQV